MPPTFLDLARSIDRVLRGNINYPLRAIVDGASSITDSDFYITIDATLGNATITLPSAITVGAGMGFKLLRLDDILANLVTVSGTGGQTINGAASFDVRLQYSSLEIVSDGANWVLFASPASFALSTDVLWSFPGTLSTGQNANLYILKASRVMSFVAFDAEVVTAPIGSSIVIDWKINDVIDPTLQVMVAEDETFGETIVFKSLAIGDTLQPVVSQVGASTPGLTMVMRARGL